MVSQITVRMSLCLAKQGLYPKVHVEMMSQFFIVLFTLVKTKTSSACFYIVLSFPSRSNSDLAL